MEPLGIYKSWTSERAILKHIDRNFALHEPRWLKQHEELQAYASGTNPYWDVVDKLKPAHPPYHFKVALSLSAKGLDHALAMRALFERQERPIWLPILAKFYALDYWKRRLEHYAQQEERSQYGVSFTFAIASLAGCLTCGWMDQAQALTREILLLYTRRRFFDITGEFGQPLYHWFFRACVDYYGWQFDGWGKGLRGEDRQCLSQPVLNDLFAHWSDNNLSPAQDHLTWLCDYYTHRTREADGTEFGNDLLHTRFPAIILAWFRLREQRGLPIPSIDHPLMQPEYARLIPAQPFYTDELLERVLARLRQEEIPDLGEMPKELPSGPQSFSGKPGLLSRWFGRR